MRAAARILAVSTTAPVAACAIVSLILYGSMEWASFLPLLFALPGSVLLLSAGYAALREHATSMRSRYTALIGIGALGGGLMLGLISAGNAQWTAMGALYGLTTALCWIGLHALTRKWSPR